MAERQFCSGWIRQGVDPRDAIYTVPRRFTRTLPPFLDLESGMGPQLNQASEGSCGPHTAAEMIDFDELAEGIPLFPPSRQFIYYATRMLMGTTGQDSGVDNRTMMKALNQYGFCPESMWPYNPSTMFQKPQSSCFQAALENRITDYAAVRQVRSEMQGCLATRRPFMYGFTVFQQMMSDQAAQTGIVAMPQGSVLGGHDITICGFSNVDRPGVKPGNTWPAGHYKARNHWLNDDGTPWGDEGYAYIPYEYAENPNYSGDFWVINTVPGVPTPPPPPAPVPTPTPAVKYLYQFQVLGAGGVLPLGSYGVVRIDKGSLGKEMEEYTNSLQRYMVLRG